MAAGAAGECPDTGPAIWHQTDIPRVAVKAYIPRLAVEADMPRVTVEAEIPYVADEADIPRVAERHLASELPCGHTLHRDRHTPCRS